MFIEEIGFHIDLAISRLLPTVSLTWSFTATCSWWSPCRGQRTRSPWLSVTCSCSLGGLAQHSCHSCKHQTCYRSQELSLLRRLSQCREIWVQAGKSEIEGKIKLFPYSRCSYRTKCQSIISISAPSTNENALPFFLYIFCHGHVAGGLNKAAAASCVPILPAWTGF